jgi:hypothetical protein
MNLKNLLEIWKIILMNMKRIDSKKEVFNLLKQEQMVMPGTYYNEFAKYQGVHYDCGCGRTHGFHTTVVLALEVVAEFEYSYLTLRCPEVYALNLDVHDGELVHSKPEKIVTMVLLKGIFNLKIASLWFANETIFMSAMDDILEIMQNS